MTESAGVQVVQGRLGSLSLHGNGSPGSTLFFNETSYLPHEIDWSYVNHQEWEPRSFQKSHTDEWVPPASTTTPWSRNGFSPAMASSQLKGVAGECLDVSNDSSLFSSSLPSLVKAKLTMSESDVDHSLGAEDEIFGSLEEMESQTIGRLLPDDEEELLAGIADELDVVPYSAEDFEDYDLFSSGGGLEMEGDSHESLHSGSAHGTIAGEHPYGEHPSRTLFVRNINSNVEDSELRELFEIYGDIRTLYTACKHRGFVMISYYDIRSARTAMRVLQGRLLRRRKLDIHFSIPKRSLVYQDNPSDKDINQGTLVVFNLDASVSGEDLRKIFGQYGEVKEIRETPHKKHHKFIEFYDVRSAEAALRALNRSDIAGKRIKLEPSRPGGVRRSLIPRLGQEFDHEDGYHSPLAWTNSPPADWGTINDTHDSDTTFISPKPLSYRPFSPKVTSQDVSSPVRIGMVDNSHVVQNTMRNHLLEQQGLGQHHPHSLPEFSSGLYRNELFSSSTAGFSTVAAPLRPIEGFETRTLSRTTSTLNDSSTTYAVHATGVASSLQRSSSLSISLTSQPMIWGSGSGGAYSQGTTAKSSSPLMWQSLSPGHPYSQRSADAHTNLYNSAFSPHSHQLGSYSRDHSLGDRHHSYLRESPEVSSYLQSGTVKSPNVGSLEHHGPSSPNFGMFLPQRLFGNCGSPLDDRRNRRMDSTPAQVDNRKQFQLDLDRIVAGEDTRTTLMIKNIPNKYTSKMLLAAIDEQHRGTYDFIYLPIDFKVSEFSKGVVRTTSNQRLQQNKCNVGYAFINMLSPSLIVSFYQTFNGKKWEKFNSEKVASLAYARIQGKAALIAHFQNSSLMNEDKRCRPIIFHSDGPNAGDQEAFPIGDNVRSGRSSGRLGNQAVEGFFARPGEFLGGGGVGDGSDEAFLSLETLNISSPGN
ncbi:protein MEI2-like 3 isoform X1 [Selaginella moellendorffii]|uniref:protein MEI2-like 3 isoform X1 n=1 Tax=Selaginella moellendorffii TaxID=88036 RepID=UPI000D1CA9A0|nr:protein MEI2-like 3 isoform X1 [Selaginella moellendorffii]|eukprot:XP_024542769.1 protein MEI2-like 3 isoform X1 [Selaginella moellendorffii]